MTDELMTAFDDSLNALAAGEPVSAILARYPALRDELAPMLAAAEAARQMGAGAAVPRAAQQRSRAQMLARAAQLRQRQGARGWLGLAAVRGWAVANRAVAVTLAFVLGFVFGTYGVLSASAASLPGEPLYTVKRTVEQTQLLFAFDPRAREQLAADFNERRVQEVERLLAGARQAPVEFGGLLEAVNGERWTVAGLTVIVPGTTEIIGTPFPGLFVQVAGLSQTDGTVVATRLEVTGLNLIGQVRSQGPDAWQVDDTVFVVNETTAITGAPALGDWVRVTARRQPDGAWLALSITREGTAPATPTPVVVTATPTATRALPTLTPSPMPSRTPAAAAPTLASPTSTAVPLEIRFTGVLEARGPQLWQVAGQIVLITAGTEIRDDPQVGQVVEVRALRAADGTVTALRIEVEDSGSATQPATGDAGGSGPAPSSTPESGDDNGDDHNGHDSSGGEERDWEGTLEAINGSTWVIAGQAVTVTGSTELRDNPQVGDQVRVRAVQTDAGWVATRIERED